ncbi:Opioid growth factor receptor (OGFr) conserved region [Methylobacterium sp. ap11]|uniref:opioid growth factor receptor-related protein n=1 Tax=Methylobacterium sp. ap11 TaxID=1761799 RepID=UPI0008B9BA45|nr:opioid growth factor receptor-related protein [Methylobacterium sp. ap11]SEP50078.1 Opioid growth factor receptor (OGFr) conserved region [Methylobacterium sp. ap11]
MTEADAGPVHAFLAGRGRDGSGRRLAEVLAFDDARIEGVHDFIQWLFPLDAPSRAVPGAPVLGPAEAAAIRADPAARAGLLAARDRMLRFYAGTTGWRRAFDHNHLRITRTLTALRDLTGIGEARIFHEAVLGFVAEAGSPVNPESLDYWRRAIED